VPEQSGCGTGLLRSGQRDLGVAQYEIHVGIANKPGTFVELASPPIAQNGEILELVLEDGKVLQLQVSGVSPYCRVIGGRLSRERRAETDRSVPARRENGRRRSDGRDVLTIHYPCPRCTEHHVLVTHRGVMMTTLFCTACQHAWGEPPAVVAAATQMDRRGMPRDESAERRNPDRLPVPTCTYCATNAYVRSIRRTHDNVYFACDGCEAMWMVPLSR
jgi:transcription elongation factor Elf1